jgi:hypothetical protein
MGTVSPDELARLWSQEKITPEMAIGHITQNLARMQGMLDSHRQMLQATLEVHQQILTTLQVDLEQTARNQPTRKIRTAR